MSGRRYTGAEKLDVAEKRARVSALAAQGLTEREIADVTGISKSRVHELIDEAVKLVPVADVETLRAASTKRLGGYLDAIDPLASKGDAEAIRAGVRADESLRRLHGVDAPTKGLLVVAPASPPSSSKHDLSKLPTSALMVWRHFLLAAQGRPVSVDQVRSALRAYLADLEPVTFDVKRLPAHDEEAP